MSDLWACCEFLRTRGNQPEKSPWNVPRGKVYSQSPIAYSLKQHSTLYTRSVFPTEWKERHPPRKENKKKPQVTARSAELPAFNLSPLTFNLTSGSAAKAIFEVLWYFDKKMLNLLVYWQKMHIFAKIFNRTWKK